MERPELRSYAAIEPKIYAYQTPGVAYHEGWTKVGEARRQSVAERIAQQTKTVGVRAVVCWERPARFSDGKDFRDTAFHEYLEAQGVERERDEASRKKLEWFRIGGGEALSHFEAFTGRGAQGENDRQTYFLRHEQAEAVLRARSYFGRGGKAFLWNAKPRFGKTLAAYELVRQMGCKRVLVLTNRPAVSDGWRADYKRFIAWQTPLLFVSENEAARRGHPEVLSRQGYLERLDAQGVGEEPYGFVAFESLQGLKGARVFGGCHDKLAWMAEIDFDLLIIDEAHEGAETERADFAIERLRHRHRLHLSGTPFKQLASGDFSEEQIFTWSYVDEQEAKAQWAGEENNPYEALPRLKMFTYQLSPMIEAEVRRGFDEEHQYAFDLTEFFKTKPDGTFAYEDKVRAFLRTLTTQGKYPFSTPELRAELKHTLWVMNRVASVKALVRLLKETGSVFADYNIVIAAGDGKPADEENAIISESSLARVRQAIQRGRPTITLSVGQLTVGVTVPEWTGILMLNECKSPAAYFQATFRVQNPHEYECEGQRYLKEEAYVFDFNPTRTLTLFEELANETVDAGAAGDSPAERRERRIRRLLNFYPVIGEDAEGRMVALDVAQVLSIPRRLKCEEVVCQGFISNFLLHGITNLFRNPKVYESILNKMPSAEDFHANRNTSEPVAFGDVEVDASGKPVVPEEKVIGTAKNLFGDRVVAYEPPADAGMSVKETPPEAYLEAVRKDALAQVTPQVVPCAAGDLKKKDQRKVTNALERHLDEHLGAAENAHKKALADAEQARAKALETAHSEAERKAVEVRHLERVEALETTFREQVAEAVEAFAREAPTVAVGATLMVQAEARKASAEEEIRKHLLGFTRTIPSFLMAYGDDGLTLANFDRYVEDDVFLEVTGITLEEFRLLRDGGMLKGERVEGHVFEETVFNDAVQGFLCKKRELANWFDEESKEDIFAYIPPQKTNQIFTPRDVVLRMVDALERENPGCFDDPERTFADLHTKSGLYLAEIAKRLYRSPAMKRRFPNDKERLGHIFTKQLYAMAPTRIVHRIVLEYLFGFDADLRQRAAAHIALADSAKAAQEGRLPALVAECFG